MALPKKIKNFLEKKKIKFEVLNHKTVYTAFDKSQTLKVPQRIVGKTLILKADRKLYLALISADKKLDFKKFKNMILAKNLNLASESLIKRKFKGVKVGAVPPFGEIWQVPTFIDKSLKKEKEIILNGGDWNTSIKISPKDLEKLFEKSNFVDIAKKE